MVPEPVEITLKNRSRRLVVRFADGFEADLDAEYLRVHSPSAATSTTVTWVTVVSGSTYASTPMWVCVHCARYAASPVAVCGDARTFRENRLNSPNAVPPRIVCETCPSFKFASMSVGVTAGVMLPAGSENVRPIEFATRSPSSDPIEATVEG